MKCEAPKDGLSNFEKEYPKCTAKDTIAILNQALSAGVTLKGEQEGILKQHGLQPHIVGTISE
jgi:hypothetical protein